MDYGFDNIFSGDGGETPSPEQMIKEALEEGNTGKHKSHTDNKNLLR